MSAAVIVTVGFEAAHRLPHLGGKCVNLHGHSWQVETSIAGEPDADGVLLEFGAIKAGLRAWIDGHLDHATMLGAADPLRAALLNAGCRVYLFDPIDPLCAAGRPLTWPTVENVAELLRRVVLAQLGDDYADRFAVSVTVTETASNAVTAR
jgi:6-pyruvoyltetrahydropterin/6-carboxytetrahydropterin synthase